MDQDKPLESRLEELLYDRQVEYEYFDELYTGIIYLMKKVVEDDSCKIQLYEIGNKEDIHLSDADTFGEYFIKLNKIREKQFGLENTLKNVLWNGQVPDEEFDKMFNEVVDIMKKVYENKGYNDQLYKIDIDKYKGDKE